MGSSTSKLAGGRAGSGFAAPRETGVGAGPRSFGPILDRLLRVHRGDRAVWLAAMQRGAERFPGVVPAGDGGFLRAAILNDAATRLVFRAQTLSPALVRVAARFVPVRGDRSAFRNAPADRPILLALMHFGPVHFVFTVLLPQLWGRNVYALHAGGERAGEAARYLRALGVTPIVNDLMSLRTVKRLMTEDPRCAVVFGFDYFGGRESRGDHGVAFLGRTVPVPRGVGYLAEATGAVVIAASGRKMFVAPRVEVAGPLELDGDLTPGERRNDLTRRLYALLDERVRAAPAEWTEWGNCRPTGA